MPLDPNVEAWKLGLQQGGLLVVVLVLFWYITQEHRRKLAAKEDTNTILVALVERNIAAQTQAEATHRRIAIALEQQRLLPPGTTA